jgi:hypothetical protein
MGGDKVKMDIRIKPLKENYVIDYNDNSQEFILKNGEETIKRGKTQKEVEESFDRILKSDNKFKTPIKTIGFVWNAIAVGVITSANTENKSFWFVDEKGTRNKGDFRNSSYSGKPNYNYFELTAKNQETLTTMNKNNETIKQLTKENENLRASLENPITLEFIANYKEAK